MAAPMGRLTVHVRRFSIFTCLNKDTLRNSKRKGSSNQWLTRQINDPYVKRANKEGWRCRSAFKLLEMNDRFNLIRSGDAVIDCGAAPGSWSQVAVQKMQGNIHEGPQRGHTSSGKVISIDLQHIEPIDGAVLYGNSDFTKLETHLKIQNALEGRLADVVLSDMAPAASGDNQLDHDKICQLCLEVLKFSSQVLASGGHVVCKLWDGRDTDKMVTVMKRMFTNVKIVKPDASRSDSAEIFLIGMDYYLRR